MFSIIICTYNPDENIFQRLLESIENFTSTSPEHEVIIVDNNSKPALCTNQIVTDFLKKNTRAKLLMEAKPGLTNARIKGITASKHDWIIFFDDDNEPSSNYLIKALACTKAQINVGAWGPGIVKVKYLGVKENNYLKNLKGIFQERKMTVAIWDNNIEEGNECYPYGTGLIIKHSILDEYITGVKNKELTMTDRNGTELTSGGDSQMIYVALRMGFYVGSSPSIKLIHNILAAKTRLRRILKLAYLVNSGQVKAYNEVFRNQSYPISEIKRSMILRQMTSFLTKVIKRPNHFKSELLNLSKNLGIVKAQIVAGNQKEFYLLTLWEKLISN